MEDWTTWEQAVHFLFTNAVTRMDLGPVRLDGETVVSVWQRPDRLPVRVTISFDVLPK